MNDRNLKPLIACVSNQPDFYSAVQRVAVQLRSDVVLTDDVRNLIRQRQDREISCVVFDYGNAIGLDDEIVIRHSRESWSLIVAVGKGNVKASFHAATRRAVNVIEKPMADAELLDNLGTALASASRVSEFLSSEEQRFSVSVFECLTTREKSVLRLMMDGEPNKRIAAILDIGLRTVELDRANTMKKLQVESYVELIKLVSRLENDVWNARKECFGRLVGLGRLSDPLRETA